MLTKGIVCSSKREALKWIGREYPEIHDTIELLDKQFGLPDDIAVTLTGKQPKELGEIYLRLLRPVKDTL